MSARLLIDPPLSGVRNMAIDEALLDSAAAGGPFTLRLYRWREATISTGYFQRNSPEVARGGRFAGLPVVRRLSGGGAILHHHELTYSVTAPPDHPLAKEPGLLYAAAHAAMRAALREQGVPVEFRGSSHEGDKTFLCFSRGDRRDLVALGQKVLGSAQRRRHGAVLQHGSLLLRASEFAPEFPGLTDLFMINLNEESLVRQFISHAGVEMAVELVHGETTPSEVRTANAIESTYDTEVSM